VVAKAAERTTKTVEKRMVFKERGRTVRAWKASGGLFWEEETGEGWDTRGTLYIAGADPAAGAFNRQV